jgi:hypothetical protein
MTLQTCSPSRCHGTLISLTSAPAAASLATAARTASSTPGCD